MYSQYIPHFPTLWLTKDERSLLYKYFILNPSLCCISSIVSSHLQILYIVQKKCWSRQRACACRQPCSSGSRGSAARAGLRAQLPPFGAELCRSRDLGISQHWMWPQCPWALGGLNLGTRAGARRPPVALQAENASALAFGPWAGWEWERKNASLLSKGFTNSPITSSRGETVSAGKIR